MTEVVSINPQTHTVETIQGQRYQGDYLVLAAGAQANFFGTPGAAEHSYPLYSLHDAQQLRSRILAMLESADRDPSLIEKGALNFVIVGGGPTGAEMAGAFGDMLKMALKREPGKRGYKNVRFESGADRSGGWRQRGLEGVFTLKTRYMRARCWKNAGSSFTSARG